MSAAIKKRVVEVQVAVLNLDDSDRTITISVEDLGELVEQGLRVCRELEQVTESDLEFMQRHPRFSVLLHELWQFREDMRKAGILAPLQEDEEED